MLRSTKQSVVVTAMELTQHITTHNDRMMICSWMFCTCTKHFKITNISGAW